jgi:ComEC/Rec2-related protein
MKLLAIILAVLAVTRIVWTEAHRPVYRPGEKIKITGTVQQEPEWYWSQQYVRLLGLQIAVPAAIEAKVGDRIEVVGTVRQRLTSNRQVRNTLEYSDNLQFRIVDRGQGVLRGARKWLQSRISGWLPGDEGAIAAGILLGGSGNLSSFAANSFRRTGLTHALAASGYNVGVVAGWAMGIGIPLWGRRRAIYFGVICIILYMFLAGLTAAVVRAAGMGILTLLALLEGRRASGKWMLGIVSAVILIINPAWVRDIGFQLSVAAMAGLLWAEPEMGRSWWKDELRTTLAAQIVTLPLILHYFGNLSLVSPLANLAILWAVPPVMQLTAVAVGLGLLFPGAGQLVAWIEWPLLKWMIGVTEWMAGWKWAAWTVQGFDWLWVIVYYLVIVLVWLRWRRRNETKRI